MDTATTRTRRAFGVRRAWLGASALAAALALPACDWGDLDGVPAGFADGVDNDTVVTAGPGLTEAGGVMEADFDDTDSHSGSSDLVARGDHDHNDDYVLKAGDTMTGPLVLNADPAADLGAATKQYVDAGRGQSVDGVTTVAGGDIDLVEGANITITPDDGTDTITIAVTGGAASGLDADTVDGVHAADFMGATEDQWVNEGGDTMTGTLVLPADGLVAGTSQFVLSSGRVGIGTAGPTGPLHVDGGSAVASGAPVTLKGQDAGGGSGGNGGDIVLTPGAADGLGMPGYLRLNGNMRFTGGDITTPDGHFKASNGSAALAAYAFDSYNHTGMFFTGATDYALGFTVVGNEFMRIDDSGNVGIGTTNPTEMLSVSGSAEVSASVKSPLFSALPGDGSAVTVRTNDGSTVSGGITIRTGDTTSNGATTGNIVLRTGHENWTAVHSEGGQLTLYGYPSGNQGGPVAMRGGDSWANAGAVTIRGGNSGSGKGGDLTLKGGGGGGGLGGGGTVIIDSGAGGSQAPGIVSFRVHGSEKMRVHSDGNVGINTASPGSALHVAGPIATATRTVAADDALTGSDSVLFVDSSGASRTITLPPASAATIGRVYHVYKADSSGVNTVNVQAAGGDVLNGAATISQPYGCLRVIGSAATQWIGNVTE